MTLKFIHVDQIKEFEIDFGSIYGVHVITAGIENYTWLRAGNRDEAWTARPIGLEVIAVNGDDSKQLVLIFQDIINRMLQEGMLNLDLMYDPDFSLEA